MRVLIPQQILAGAWHLVWRQWREWFDRALIPLIWLLALDLLLLPDPSQITGLTAETAQAQSGDVMRFFGSVVLYMVLSLAIWTMFATAWLRACSGAPPSVSLAGLSWSRFESRVLGAAIRLLLILLAGFALIMVLFGSGVFRSGLTPATALSFAIFALLAMAPLLARSCLILPAAATGQASRLVDSWRATQGNALRLTFMLTGLVVLGYFVSFLVASLLGGIFASLFGSPLSLGPRLVMLLAINLMSLATSAFTLAVVALAYRQLGGGPGLQVVPPNAD